MTATAQPNTAERNLLLQHYRKSRDNLTGQRAHAILLSSDGYSCYQIAGMLYRSEKTVRVWIRAFTGTRMASIFPHYTDNEHAAKLTRAQKEEIKKEEIKQVLSKEPSDYGIPASFWDVSALKSYIKAESGRSGTKIS